MLLGPSRAHTLRNSLEGGQSLDDREAQREARLYAIRTRGYDYLRPPGVTKTMEAMAEEQYAEGQEFTELDNFGDSNGDQITEEQSEQHIPEPQTPQGIHGDDQVAQQGPIENEIGDERMHNDMGQDAELDMEERDLDAEVPEAEPEEYPDDDMDGDLDAEIPEAYDDDYDDEAYDQGFMVEEEYTEDENTSLQIQRPPETPSNRPSSVVQQIIEDNEHQTSVVIPEDDGREEEEAEEWYYDSD
uniref:ARAD1D30800p n=1 Tax=Blastobotrys adeninivorans TaxID=409370 RepID=A0A060TBV9_BLAAD